MKTLDRYIAILFLKNLALALFAFVSIFLFQQLIGDLYEHAFPSNQLLVYNLLNLPQIMVQIAPPAVLAATVLTLAGLARNNELTACYSIGVGLKRIGLLLSSIVFMVCCLVLICEDRILPPTYKRRTAYFWREMKKRPDFYLDIKQDKIWYRSKNLIYNLQRFDTHTKTIVGMSVYTFDENFNLVQVVSAEKAEFKSTGWRLQDGTVTLFTADDPFPLTQKFKEKDLTLTERPEDFMEIDKEVDGLRLKELWHYIARIQQAGADTKQYRVKFQQRISLSFMPLIMCFLGIPFSTRSKREGGIAKDLLICGGFAFFYWIFFAVGLSLGVNGALPPLLAAWLPSLVFGALAVTLIARRQLA